MDIKKSVLVVDDNSTNLMIAKRILESYDLEIDVASSGAEALELAKTKQYRLVFMDQMMPEMDGVEATKELRKLEPEYCKTVPVVALTANVDEGAREELLASGFDEYVPKPIELKNFERVIYKYLDIQRKQQADVKKESLQETVLFEGIDSAAAMAKMHLDEATYLSIVKNYYRDLMLALPRIRMEKETGDMEGFVIDVHSVKSTSAGVGAMELSGLAKALESAGKEENLDYIDSHIDDFFRCYNQILKELGNYFTKQKKTETEKEKSVLEKSWLEAVRQACENMDSSEAENLLKQIANKRFSEEETELVHKIEAYVDQYDYDEVLELLAEVEK